VLAKHKAVLLIHVQHSLRRDRLEPNGPRVGASPGDLRIRPSSKNILDNVIFLLVPSFNPDGQIIVTDWYNKNVGTEWEYSFLPELYHKYAGHDNNRDSFMNTQVESRMINRLMYKEWFPPVYLDEHQMAATAPESSCRPSKIPSTPMWTP